jgi:hypothetical protein
MITRLEVRVHIACGPALCAATTFGEQSVSRRSKKPYGPRCVQDGTQGLERARRFSGLHERTVLVLATRHQCG